jgi:hypothetical protein
MLRSFLLRIRPSVVGVDLPRTLFGSQFYATANLGSAQTQTVPSADAIGKEVFFSFCCIAL